MDALTKIKAEGLAALAEQTTGVKPTVVDYGDHIKIFWDAATLPEARQKFEQYVSEIKPGDIRIEWLPVVQNVAIKKAAPFIIGIFAAGFIIGKMTK